MYNCTYVYAYSITNLLEAGAAEETDGVDTAQIQDESLNMSAASKKKRRRKR